MYLEDLVLAAASFFLLRTSRLDELMVKEFHKDVRPYDLIVSVSIYFTQAYALAGINLVRSLCGYSGLSPHFQTKKLDILACGQTFRAAAASSADKELVSLVFQKIPNVIARKLYISSG